MVPTSANYLQLLTDFPEAELRNTPPKENARTPVTGQVELGLMREFERIAHNRPLWFCATRSIPASSPHPSSRSFHSHTCRSMTLFVGSFLRNHLQMRSNCVRRVRPSAFELGIQRCEGRHSRKC